MNTHYTKPWFDEKFAEAIAARSAVTQAFETRRIVQALEECGRLWSDPKYPARVATTEEIAKTSKMPIGMLSAGFDDLFQELAAEKIWTWILEEVQNPSFLDPFSANGNRSAASLSGPQAVFHSLAGNVPGLAIPAIAAGLIARSIVIIRDSKRQPVLTQQFCKTLKTIEPLLSSMIIPLTWKAERSVDPKEARSEIELAVLAVIDRAEIYGADHTVNILSHRYKQLRNNLEIVDRGERLSIVLVPRNVRVKSFGAKIAYDMVMYEGRGCLTPRIIFIEGNAKTAAAMAKAVAHSLADIEKKWPRVPGPLAAEAARRSFLDTLDLHALRSDAPGIQRGHDDAWVVVVDKHGGAPRSIGERTVVCIPVQDLAQAASKIDFDRETLAGVGIAADSSTEEYERAADLAAEWGATHICPTGRMQRPSLGWNQDGTQRIGDLLNEDEISAA